MTRLSAFAVALAAATVIGSVSLAAEAAQTLADTNAQTSAATVAQKDFASLSGEGRQALQDMRLARFAIFDGDTAKAKSLVGDARDQLGLARKSDAAFMKAEADIKPPAGTAAAKPDMPKPDASKPAAQAVAWLPVDGQVMVDEAFQPTPENQKAVAAADTHLKAGEKAKAEEALKPVGLDVGYAMALAPLEATSSAADKAATLIDQGKFYEANLALKSAEDGIVVDVVDVSATPTATADAGKPAAVAIPAPAPATGKTAAAPAPAPMPAPAPKEG